MFIFLDTETTGTREYDRLCQIAFKTETGLIVNELFNHGKPISIEAMSVHHITDEMVKNKPQFKHSKTWTKLTDLFADTSNIMVAHNAMFDVAMLNKEVKRQYAHISWQGFWTRKARSLSIICSISGII